jgi:chemotaxis signal transduction protein
MEGTMAASKKDKEIEERRFCSFYLADRLFGIDISVVKEINDDFHLTYIYHTLREISGYVNIRGQIFLILDMHCLMGMEQTAANQNAKLILFKTDQMENCGILVDDVGDVIDIPTDRIEDRRKGRSQQNVAKERRKESSQLGEGVCKLDNQLMVIVNPLNMLGYVEEKVINPV